MNFKLYLLFAHGALCSTQFALHLPRQLLLSVHTACSASSSSALGVHKSQQLAHTHTRTHCDSNTHPQAHTQCTYSSITRKRKERTKTKRRLQLGITCFFAALQKIQHLAVFFDCSSPLLFSFFGNSRRRFSLLPVNQMSAQ